MVDAITLVALALLVVGVLGTILPLVPGGLSSLAGVTLYWWHTDFTEPGLLAVAVLTILACCAMLAEFVGGAVSARAGGASWETTAAAVVVGIVLLVVTGPVGLLVGLFGTVFALEFRRHGDLEASARAAALATAGHLASTGVQVVLTATILVAFVLLVFVV